MKYFSKRLACLLLVLLLAAAALTGCAQKTEASSEASRTEAQTQAAPQSTEAALQTTEAVPAESKAPEELGEGSKVFRLVVTDKEGVTSSYAIHTDAETVGAALSNLGLISGENGMYDTVFDKTLDWNADHMYWAFYVDGAYAMTGLDETPIAEDALYALTATAG